MNIERTTSGNGDGDGDAVLRAVGRLPQSVEPRRDLWPAIARGLDQPAAAHRARFEVSFSFAAAAAIGCLALGALLSYAVLRQDTGTGVPTDSSAVASNRPTVQQASFGSYAALGPEYERARAALVIDLAERLDRLPPVTRLKVEKNLAEIQRAVTEINAALERSPGDSLLQELLMNTYQDELSLLAHLNQTTGSLPART
jgi:hypothetical protein